jgi:hypothetical protein
MSLRLRERLYKGLHEKNAIQRFLARRFLFGAFQRLGFHISGDHFYEIVPNTRTIARLYPRGPRPLTGIDWRFAECEQRALRLFGRFGAEYAEACRKHGFKEDNPYFKGLDALALYVMLRDLKPEKLLEVGQGISTQVALWALQRNTQETGRPVEFVSIDPYERTAGLQCPERIRMTILGQPLEAVALEALLEGSRFVFVDSSHVYKFGSDVALEFVRIYPRLLPGTVLHLHDIYSPYEYPLDWLVYWKRFWNEQYFLECFLMFNDAFEVLLPMNLLTEQSKAMVEAAHRLPLAENFRFRGSSFYLLRK